MRERYDLMCPRSWKVVERETWWEVEDAKGCLVTTHLSLLDATAIAEDPASLKAQLAEALEALRKYTHCRHACIDCFCTREAIRAIASHPSSPEAPKGTK